ncbi:transketolase [Cardiobacteriaceae bacterium TAE3-ERU3]|nr:transketolase [Cardiobacteriaceae bacterium TAE3-ERU3]
MTEHQLMAGAVRALSMDAVQQANSGHPGAPMGMADMATVLWQKHIRVNPKDPKWHNRDRFVLSNGHASMLQYSLLHLAGFDLSLDEIKQFRQLHSKTPGHPEVDETPGVETTTGPLGQGIANAVGMALAEQHLAAQFNRDQHKIVDHYTYCFVGDGCLMEGVSHEACSFAGTLGLGKLIVLYDANGISIDGEIEPWYSEDVAKRFEAYGWQVIDSVDGHDADSIDQAINNAKQEQNRPSLIICKTVIGFGSPNLAGTAKSHGAPLGDEEISKVKSALELPEGKFSVPEGAYEVADLRERGENWQKEWQASFDAYAKAYPELAERYQETIEGKLSDQLDQAVKQALKDKQAAGAKVATRKASEQALEVIAPFVPGLLGGSADLSGSNNTSHKHSAAIKPRDFAGNYIHYGVREFAMAAMMNGMSLHGGIRPYGGTFLVFSDYMRNAMRLSALMKQPVVYVLTHDSIGLGEDGPTHQPIEHVSSLRLMPNMYVWRPCDDVETLAAWHASIKSDMPSSLALSRQGLPSQARDEAQIDAIYRGGYVLSTDEQPDAVLIATGSEVALAADAADALRKKGKKIRVVSVPCYDLFMKQDAQYRREVLGGDVPKLAIEAGVSALWQGLVGERGAVIGIDCFGASAPAEELFKEYGFTVENVIAKTLDLL